MHSLVRFTSGLLAVAALVGGLAPQCLVAQPALGPTARKQDRVVVPYRITRGDKVAVSVFGESDLTTGNKRVDARGMVNLQLVGDVRLFGLTLPEAAQAIANAYVDGRILRKPEVTVTVEEYAPRTVTVGGKVKYPQKVNLPPEEQWTIKDVIMQCGGFEDTARGTGVILTREMPDGSRKSHTLDVQSALVGKDRASKSADASFVVEPGDHVHVPEKLI